MKRSSTLARRLAAVGLTGAALVLAACGSSSTTSTTSASASQAASSSPPASSGSAAAIALSTTSGPGGSHLVGAGERAVYLWVADAGGQSACSGQCARVWPPVTGTPTAGGALKASDLGTITRADGSKQVTYNGHPLYYYIADTSSGSLHGQGSDSFGAKWWLVSPAGVAITSNAQTAGQSSGSNSTTTKRAGGGWA